MNNLSHPKKYNVVIITVLIIVTGLISGCSNTKKSNDFSCPLTAPKLTNNPYYDIISTNTRPLLSFFNASGGKGRKKYTIQISKDSSFTGNILAEYKQVPEETKYITGKLVEEKDALEDKTRYYWRVMAEDEDGNQSPWAKSRFYLDTESDNSFMNLVRIPVEKIEVSSGSNAENITDISDEGLQTSWTSAPPGDSIQWVKFEFAKVQTITRLWMLSNSSSSEGWLINFEWQKSMDGFNWTEIRGTKILNNDTYRNTIDIEPIDAKYLRLLIKKWYGFAPQINTVILYSPGKPPVPVPPDNDYVLVVGNQMNGYTFSELAEYIEENSPGLKTLTIPHYEVYMELINKLKKKPAAIVLSGNNADYQDLPMFEYNGEFEIIRECEIPVLGICAGHQLSVMAYGYTYARSMGWSDITAMEIEEHDKIDSIHIIKSQPIFEGIPNPFIAAEIHGWSVTDNDEILKNLGYEIIAKSVYVQAFKSNKKFLYGEQFHAEVKVPYNQGHPYLINFLKLALENKNLN